MGADFIEPDLVSTKDGVLIARHENEIGGTTDVAERFPDRKRPRPSTASRSPAGSPRTSRSPRSRRCARRSGWRSARTSTTASSQVPTFDEVIELAQQLGARARAADRRLSRRPSIRPTSAASACRSRRRCSRRSRSTAGTRRDAPVFIQSFESGNLRELRQKTTVRLMQLRQQPAMPSTTRAEGHRRLRRRHRPGEAAGRAGRAPTARCGRRPTSSTRAHAAGLLVHVWTLRSDKEFLPAGYKGDGRAEFQQLRQLGVDGVFTDFPDVAARGVSGQVAADTTGIASIKGVDRESCGAGLKSRAANVGNWFRTFAARNFSSASARGFSSAPQSFCQPVSSRIPRTSRPRPSNSPARTRSINSVTPAPRAPAVTTCAISFTDGSALATATARPHARRNA